MTNFLTHLGVAAAVIIVFVAMCCGGVVWIGHQFLFDRMHAAETRISILQRRATIAEDRMNVMVKRLGGTPTRIQKHYTDPLSNGLPGDDEWPLTPEEFEEWQRKLREEKEREKKQEPKPEPDREAAKEERIQRWIRHHIYDPARDPTINMTPEEEARYWSGRIQG